MRNKFIKLTDDPLGRVLYVNIDDIVMMFAADDEPSKTIIMLRHNHNGITNRLIVREKVEYIYNTIADFYQGHSRFYDR